MKRLILKDNKTGARAYGFIVRYKDGRLPSVNPLGRQLPAWAAKLRKITENTKPRARGTIKKLNNETFPGPAHIGPRPPAKIEDWIKRVGLENTAAIIPARAPSFNSDVRTPLAQACISGAIVGAVGAALDAALWHLIGYSDELAINGLIVAGLIGLGVAAWQWFDLIQANRATLWGLEMLAQQDIDGDGQIGRPTAPRAINTNKGQPLAMPAQPGELWPAEWQQVAIAVIGRGANISRRGICDNSDLGQDRATEAVKALSGYKTKEHKPNQAGYDFLLPYLPPDMDPAAPYPTE